MDDYRWATDLSLQFLERDYLLPGQTLDERVTEICDNAERILAKPGFAEKFKDNFKKGWYSFSTPVWINFGTDRGLPISCITGETWINMPNIGGKQARDVQIGDFVLTHKGRYRPVTHIIKTENKSDIWKLKINTRMTNLYITGNHLVLTNMGWIRVDKLNPKVHLVAVNREIETNSSKNFTNIDITPFVRYEYDIKSDGKIYALSTSKDTRPSHQIKDGIRSQYSTPYANIKIDSEIAWFFGLWFAEGSLGTDNKKEPNGIKITLDTDEIDLAERWLEIAQRRLGINGNIYQGFAIRNGKKNTWLNVSVNSVVIGEWFKTFGDGCKRKIIPDYIMQSSQHILKSFMLGLRQGDGHQYKSGKNKVTLSNPELILQAYEIGLRIEEDMSLQMQEKAPKLATTSHVYTIVFNKSLLSSNRNNAGSAIPFKDGLYYCPIKTLEKTERIDTVYDFTVEEDHSFSAAGVILHNCFGSSISDSMESILNTQAEVGMMTKYGGGTSAYFGNLRPRGAEIKNNGTSSGSVHFMQLFDTVINVVSQGSARRGNFAAHLPIEHPDIDEFLTIRKEGSPIQDLWFGVTVTDEWMQSMIDGDQDKRRIWAKVLESRSNMGGPYITFIDNANNASPDVYQDKGLKITHSNLCQEIMLADGPDESFVCCLSSMNDLYFDEWKDTDAVELMVYFLDSVMTEFIDKAASIPFMERAVNFARNQRAIGIGQLGWHSYLQSQNIAFESLRAKALNNQIAKTIHDQAYAASAKMAQEYGEPPLLEGYGRRHTTLLAIAPTKSSAFILGQVSEGIEPHLSNYYIKDLAKGKFTIKNSYLVDLLKSKDMDSEDVWLSILQHGGSVQHLDFLDQHDKDVFKTFGEISQKEIVIQAAQRQKWIDQSQSLNLAIHPSIPIKDVNALIIEAWQLGVKSLYYQISTNAAQEFVRDILNCVNCEA